MKDETNNRIVLGVFFTASAMMLGWILFRPIAKYEICKKYYPEISRFSCLLSDYGLPPRGGAK
jgi:hypothetical protein